MAATIEDVGVNLTAVLHPMFRFTIRDVIAVIGAAALVVVIAVSSFAIAWWRNDPFTRAGSLRRGLEGVQQGAAERDKQVKDLTTP